MRKDIFEHLGYFYEKFIYAGEDAEFYQLVKDAGYSTTIASDAKCFWFTPKDRKEFLKQIKNYSIADMQIYGFKNICKRESRNIEKLIVDAICILGTGISLFANAPVASLFLALFVVLHAVDYYKYREKNYKMIVEQRYYKLYYYFCFRKYFGKEYLVNREVKR